MIHRADRSAARLALVISCLVLSTGVLLAQNENETTGFQSTHAFASGQFGENIDILNGGVVLTTPIGQRYQVNDRLGYQLAITYSSKIWDYSEFLHSDSTSVRPVTVILPEMSAHCPDKSVN